MKVFISWSGDRSRHIAKALKDWLPDVLQAVKPWMSDTDIESGQKWQSELSKQLNECEFGIVCVTPENKASPWLNFEAGALSKALKDVTFVCPYLYEMKPEGITGPLSQFQSKQAGKEGTRELVYNINGRLEEDDKLTQVKVEKAFDRCWGELEKNLQSAPSTHAALRKVDPLALLPEILENTRALRREFAPKLGVFEQADVDLGVKPKIARNLLERLVRDGGETNNFLRLLVDRVEQNTTKDK